MHFVPYKKIPFLENGTVHQFAAKVNQFCSIWYVDVSQQFDGGSCRLNFSITTPHLLKQ